jgi:hypothetical protein
MVRNGSWLGPMNLMAATSTPGKVPRASRQAIGSRRCYWQLFASHQQPQQLEYQEQRQPLLSARDRRDAAVSTQCPSHTNCPPNCAPTPSPQLRRFLFIRVRRLFAPANSVEPHARPLSRRLSQGAANALPLCSPTTHNSRSRVARPALQLHLWLGGYRSQIRAIPRQLIHALPPHTPPNHAILNNRFIRSKRFVAHARRPRCLARILADARRQVCFMFPLFACFNLSISS